MIKITNLSKGYSGGDVIQNISVEFDTGVIYGLIGPNGSGKSTLMKCLEGIYKPDQGEVLLGSQSVYDNPYSKTKLAYVDEDLKYNTFYTVKKQAKVYSYFFSDFSQSRFDELATAFQLNQKEYVSNLSLGQKKKLSICLALARKTKYLLLDEPENGLDTESRMLFRKCLRDAADEGTCVILSSHDLVNIEGICDEILFLRHGQIIYKDTVDALFEQVSKLVIKSAKTDLPQVFVLDEFEDMKTIVFKGTREKAQTVLEKADIEIVSFEKVNLADAYLAYGMEGGSNDRSKTI